MARPDTAPFSLCPFDDATYLDENEWYSSYLPTFAWQNEPSTLPPNSLATGPFQIEQPTQLGSPLEYWQNEDYLGQCYPQSNLRPTWMDASFREASPAGTTFSSYSSNSSSYNDNLDGSELDLRRTSYPYPTFDHRHYSGYESFESSPDSPLTPDPCINPIQVQIQPDHTELRSLFPEDEVIPIQQSKLFQPAVEDDDADASETGATCNSDTLSDVRDDDMDSCASDANDSEYTPSQTKSRRGSRKNGLHLHATAKGRVSKKAATSPNSRKPKQSTASPKSPSASDSEGKAARHFTCPLTPYGCHGTFASKNEWKRHVTTKHLCLGHWQCNLCSEKNDGPNIFNRRDLFQQHVKRMHRDDLNQTSTKPHLRNAPAKAPATKSHRRQSSNGKDDLDEAQWRILDQICDDCWCQTRDAPAVSTCAFCKSDFTGRGSCEEWLEHTGKHLASQLKHRTTAAGAEDMENGNEVHIGVERWVEDGSLREWLLFHGDIVPGPTKGTWQMIKRAV